MSTFNELFRFKPITSITCKQKINVKNLKTNCMGYPLRLVSGLDKVCDFTYCLQHLNWPILVPFATGVGVAHFLYRLSSTKHFSIFFVYSIINFKTRIITTSILNGY